MCLLSVQLQKAFDEILADTLTDCRVSPDLFAENYDNLV